MFSEDFNDRPTAYLTFALFNQEFIGRISPIRRGARVVEGARLESVCAGNRTEGSNPSLPP